jgi:sugar phosphate permease
MNNAPNLKKQKGKLNSAKTQYTNIQPKPDICTSFSYVYLYFLRGVFEVGILETCSENGKSPKSWLN